MKTRHFILKTQQLLLVAILLAHSLVFFGQTYDNQQQKDSLRQVIAATEGEEKLNGIKILSMLYFNELGDDKKMDTLIVLLNEGYKEALRQNNVKLQGGFAGSILSAYFNKGRHDDVIKRAPEFLKQLEEKKAWDYYYDVYKKYFLAFLDKGNYDTAVQTAEQMYADAKARDNKFGMGVSSFCFGRFYYVRDIEEAITYLKQCIELLNNEDKYLSTSTEVYFYLCQALILQKHYDEAQRTLAKYEKAIDSFENYVKMPQVTARGNLYMNYIQLSLLTEDFDNAEIYCDKIDKLSLGSYTSLSVFAARALIHNARKEYDKALEMTDKALQLTNSEAARNEIRETRMQILANTGRSMELYQIAEKVITINDSIRNADFSGRLDGLRTQYEVDKHIAKEQKARLSFYFSAGIGVLLLVILIIWFFYSRKIHKKNKALVEQILAQEKDQVEIDKLRKIAQENIRTEQETDEIFIRLEKLMQEQQPYVETECNRKTLAEAVGTNEKYLSDSIKNNTGLPVSEYIMKYRLKHANTLLLRPAAEYTIDAVAIDSGFGSRSKFHEHYRNRFGITPNEFRKTIQAKKE